ncbi:MAG: alpha/beta hydrolase [Armatimonadota bacterium]
MVDNYFKSGFFVREVKNDDAEGTIFYIHGLGESGLCFEELMTDTRINKWNHISLDIPGYGKSPREENPLSFKQMVSLFSKWIKKNIKEPVVLLGHSMGGVIGTILCEKHPGLIKAFINVEGNLSLQDCTFSWKAAEYTLPEFKEGGFENMCNIIYKAGIKETSLRGYYASLRMCDINAYYKNSLELVELSKKEQLAERLFKLKIPVSYILGHPGGVGEYSRSLLSRAGIKYHVIEGAGHWPLTDQPDKFIENISSFLNSVDTCRL